jgi:O-acetyl-ADP-ribose deacetylase (regulator of RNase III)
VFIFDRSESLSARYIVHFPTKNHWRDSSRLEDISTGLESLLSELRRLQIASIAMPALGCGLGGLDWPEVKETISNVFLESSVDVRVQVYEPL